MLPTYPEPAAGQNFGKYFLLEKRGWGSFGVVFRAMQTETRHEVALKIARQLNIPQQRLFAKEAEKLAELSEEYTIVHLYDCGIVDNRPFLALNYLPHTLREKYQEHPRGLAPATILRYLQQAARGLQYAHKKQIMHLDIKPENLLLSSEDQLQVSDFGIAVFVRDILKEPRPVRRGTPSYSAPEQLRGKPCLASDQYSLALVVYEGLTGKHWRAGIRWRLQLARLFAPGNSEFMLALLPVLLRALASDPQKRFATVQDFAREFEQAHCAYEQQSQGYVLLRTLRPFLLGLLMVLLVLGGTLSPLLTLRHTSSPLHPTPRAFVSKPAPNLTATETAGLALYRQATASSPTFSRSLSSQQADWDNGTGPIGSCLFAHGSYEVTVVRTLGLMNCLERTQRVKDFALQADLVIKSGDYGGLLFRYDAAQNAGYRFVIGPDIPLWRLVIYNHGISAVLSEGQPSGLSTIGEPTYRLIVIAQGNRFFLYLNQQFVSEVPDPNATFQVGSIGLVAEAVGYGPLPTVVDFQNLRLWSLA